MKENDMNESSPRSVRVWDAPVRIFHWLMVLSFAGAWLTAESERWRLVHVTLGYTMAGLVVFRLVWGVVGTRHARFADFVRGPAAVGRYLRSLLQRRPEPHAGHNPAGGWAILALLVLAVLATPTLGASGSRKRTSSPPARCSSSSSFTSPACFWAVGSIARTWCGR
jgi:cytochrome b